MKENPVNEIQIASFNIGDVLLGIDIALVKEICRPMGMTHIPHVAQCVRGVINLRGEVVTLLDLRQILCLSSKSDPDAQLNLIVQYHGEHVGLCVDHVSDILTLDPTKIEPAPTNIDGIDGRFFRGVYPLKEEIVLVLNLEQVLDSTMV